MANMAENEGVGSANVIVPSRRRELRHMPTRVGAQLVV